MRRLECLDADAQPIPWYTYPAIEFIRQIDFSDQRVFEFGSGNSTLFWAKRAMSVVAVEHDPAWHEKIANGLPENVEYLLRQGEEDYVESIERFAGFFDVIIIDGIHRFDCAVRARRKLAANGLIILDNADWKHKTTKFLRDSDLIEVDMTGFGPINGYTWTTSFFLTRQIRLKPAFEHQPLPGPGGLTQIETCAPKKPRAASP